MKTAYKLTVAKTCPYYKNLVPVLVIKLQIITNEGLIRKRDILRESHSSVLIF